MYIIYVVGYLKCIYCVYTSRWRWICTFHRRDRSKFCISVWMLLFRVMLEGAYSGWTLYFTHCSVAVGPRSKQEMDGRGCSFSFRFFFSMGGRDLWLVFVCLFIMNYRSSVEWQWIVCLFLRLYVPSVDLPWENSLSEYKTTWPSIILSILLTYLLSHSLSMSSTIYFI